MTAAAANARVIDGNTKLLRSRSPAAGSQTNRKESTVIRIKPNQNDGTETAANCRSEITRATGPRSMNEEMTPKPNPSTVANNAASPVNFKVEGSRAEISSQTGRPLRIEVPKSPWLRSRM